MTVQARGRSNHANFIGSAVAPGRRSAAKGTAGSASAKSELVRSRNVHESTHPTLGICQTWYVWRVGTPDELLFRIQRYQGGSCRYVLAELVVDPNTGHHHVKAGPIPDFATLDLAFAKACKIYAQAAAA